MNDHPNCTGDGFLYRAFKDSKHLDAFEKTMEQVVERVSNAIRDIKLQDALKHGTITVIDDEVKALPEERES
jgi:hypothetical protein